MKWKSIFYHVDIYKHTLYTYSHMITFRTYNFRASATYYVQIYLLLKHKFTKIPIEIFEGFCLVKVEGWTLSEQILLWINGILVPTGFV